MDVEKYLMSEKDVLKLFKKAIEVQSLLDELTPYQLHELDNLITKELFRIEGRATSLMAANPDYNYPETVSNRRDKIMYWQSKYFDNFGGLRVWYITLDDFQKKLLTIYQEKKNKSKAEHGLQSNKPKKDIRDRLKRKEIIKKAHDLKNNGMSVENMFHEVKSWLLDELKFTNDELQHKYGFKFHDHEEAHHTFNKFVNKNRFENN